MGALHNITQLAPFVLSGDGAFLPVHLEAERELENLVHEVSSENRSVRPPVEIQQSNQGLEIHGSNTLHRDFSTTAEGSFLYLRPGGKNGYATILSNFVQTASACLGDFWFFDIWNGDQAFEYFQSAGKLKISRHENLSTNDESDFICSKLKNDPKLRQQYLVQSAMWAKRHYLSDLDEFEPEESQIWREEFPDSIRLLEKSLRIDSNHSETLRELDWYRQNIVDKPAG